MAEEGGRHKLHVDYSASEVANARYDFGKEPKPMHNIEDKHFVLSMEHSSVFCVLDGHDGANAVEFVHDELKRIFSSKSWETIARGQRREHIVHALKEFFTVVDRLYFEGVRKSIDTKKRIQDMLQGLNSYEAFQRYPEQVRRLQKLEMAIQGGSTACLVILCGDVLYTANVGDSRALLFYEDGHCEQLTVDHDTNNEDELRRLQLLGLDHQEIKKNKRIGSHENTRSFGDYSLKEGYKDTDSLQSATGPVGTAEPYISGPHAYQSTWRYIVLMTDGVYKSLASLLDSDAHDDSVNRQLLSLIQQADAEKSTHFTISGVVLSRIVVLHERTYIKYINSTDVVLKQLAVQCSKRDDLTLVVIKLRPVHT